MGLISATAAAVKGVLADQWKEYFYCDAMDADLLMVRGEKKKGRRLFGSGNHGDDAIISNGSVIAVADGQCMLIVEQGKVVELCAEPGEFVWDSSTEPSIFTGSLSDSVRETFKNIGKRISFGGTAAKDQRVYYINTREITGCRYGTASPVPFRVVDRNIGLDVDISVRCFGEYSFRITDPILFYTNVAANVADAYRRDEIDGQLKTELLTALQPAFAKISAMGIRYSEVPAHTAEVADALNEQLSKKWKELRGIEIVSFGVSSITASEEDEKMIKDMQKSGALRDPSMAAATLAAAQADAMRSAASNANGAAMGFMGLNMAGQAGGANLGQLYGMAAQNGQGAQNSGAQAAPQSGASSQGGAIAHKKFCTNCGTPYDADNPPRFCPNCGSKIEQ